MSTTEPVRAVAPGIRTVKIPQSTVQGARLRVLLNSRLGLPTAKVTAKIARARRAS